MCLPYFLQVFSLSVRSDSDSEHQRGSFGYVTRSIYTLLLLYVGREY